MKGKVKRKVIAWVLSFALVMGTVLGVPGLFMKAHAADAGVLYIICLLYTSDAADEG